MAIPAGIMLKVVVVGDYGVGKTALIETIQNGAFSDTVASAVDTFDFYLQYEQSNYGVSYWDIRQKGEYYERMRPLHYPQSDAFLLCYSADSPESFDHVISKWLPELNHHCPKVPKVLMCTKTDLRKDEAVITALAAQFQRGPIEAEEGIELAKHIGATLYLESSAKRMVGLSSLHIDMIRATIQGQPKDTAPKKPIRRKGECSIL